MFKWFKAVFVLLGLAVVAGIVFVIWLSSGLGPVDASNTKTQIVSVERGKSVSGVLEDLESKGIIKSSKVMRLFVSSVAAGAYELSPSQSGFEIAKILRNGLANSLTITIPEGYTEKQIARVLEERRVISQADFFAAITGRDWSSEYPFLKNTDKSLEGFLFPDTYFFAPGTEADVVVRTFLDNFRTKVESLGLLGQNDLYKIINFAAMVEREARTKQDMLNVASVLNNRVEAGMRLDVDATVRYALDKWNDPLTATDLQLDSPYNTRKYKGLPPTPIANPGAQAISAVINAPETDYLYYLTDAKGITYFARTLEEHNQNKAKYLR